MGDGYSVPASFDPAHGMLEIQRWVLSWGRHVRVLAPKMLLDSVRDEVKKMAKTLRLVD